MIAGKHYYGKDVMDQEGELFQDIIKEIEALFGSTNLNDHFPVPQWGITKDRLEKRMLRLRKKMGRFLQNLNEEHWKACNDSSSSANLSDDGLYRGWSGQASDRSNIRGDLVLLPEIVGEIEISSPNKIQLIRNLPPSPLDLPIIGHLYLLKEPVHRTLHQLSEKHGHILFLKFGARNVPVVSSPTAVEECFTKNDIIFANRPQLLAGKHLNYNYTTIGLSSYGDHWRNLRRLTTIELFSTSRLATFSGIREQEVRQLLKQLFQDSSTSSIRVKLGTRLVDISFNSMLRMIAGDVKDE
ncbi:hypothetical protein GH714_004917 [Hevea brasiliensis]|uniref:Cytochrome P450 n=1 Tax=Hevea brasiliensis TaxID=3981 RepID=A0A6A6MB70_HEVBR|nr:hypothetical protein GH714_004917 [Hevea brasiliensis]